MKKLSDTYKKLSIDFTFPIEIRNSNGKETYYEDSEGFWRKYEYDTNSKETYYENSNDYWSRYEYDDNSNETYFEDSNDFWYRYEYDTKGNPTYYENSDGSWCKREYDTNGNLTYYEDSEGLTEGTPRSQPSETLATNDEIAELKGQLSELRKMLSELHEINAELHKDKQRLDWIQFTDLTLHHWEEGDLWSRNGVYTIREFIDKEM